MPRAKRGFKARRRRNRILNHAEGFWGGRSRLFAVAVEVVHKAWQYAYIGREPNVDSRRAGAATASSTTPRASGAADRDSLRSPSRSFTRPGNTRTSAESQTWIQGAQAPQPHPQPRRGLLGRPIATLCGRRRGRSQGLAIRVHRPRAKRGFKARRRRNRILNHAEGFWGGRSRLFAVAVEVVHKAWQYAYIGREPNVDSRRAGAATASSTTPRASGAADRDSLRSPSRSFTRPGNTRTSAESQTWIQGAQAPQPHPQPRRGLLGRPIATLCGRRRGRSQGLAIRVHRP